MILVSLVCASVVTLAIQAQTAAPAPPAAASTALVPDVSAPDLTVGVQLDDAVDVEAALAAHAAGILAERRVAFVAAYRESNAEGQEAARAVFAARAGLGAPALMAPPEHVLSAATRYARGDVAPRAPYPALVAIADNLDVRSAPGALAAGVATEAQLVLSWIQMPSLAGVPEALSLRFAVASPRAPEERSVEDPAAFRVISLGGIDFAPRELGLEGATVPVVLPPLAQGEHFLAFELEHDGHIVPGFFVPLEVVDGLEKSLAATLLPRASPLARLVQFGVRTEGRGSLAEWVRANAAREEALTDRLTQSAVAEGASVVAEALTVGGEGSDATAAMAAWIGPPLGAVVAATVFVDVAPPSDPTLWLAGAAGAPWRALGDRGVRVVALRFALGARTGAIDGPGTSLGIVSAWAEAERSVPRVLVCSGERLGVLAPLLAAREDVFQGLVFLAAPSQVALPGWRDVPSDGGPAARRTLHVTCLAQKDVDPPETSGDEPRADDAARSGDPPGRLALVGRVAPPPVVALELPELFMRHLLGRLALPTPLPRVPTNAPHEASKPR